MDIEGALDALGAPSPKAPPARSRAAERMASRASRLETLADVRAAAQERWLTNDEVLDVLTHARGRFGMPVQEKPTQQPPSGSLWLYSKATTRNFRSDGLEWRKKKNQPTSVVEGHEKLKVAGEYRLAAYYATSADGLTLRRVYARLDHRDDVLVHYRHADPADAKPEKGDAKARAAAAAAAAAASGPTAADAPMAMAPSTAAGAPPAAPPTAPTADAAAAAGSPPSAQQRRILELEARIRELELQKQPTPALAPHAPAAAASSSAAEAAAAPVALTITGGGGGGGALEIVDFSPEWDAPRGGAKLLVTASGLVAGARYAAAFGPTAAPAEMVNAHVLRLRVPPSAAGPAVSAEVRVAPRPTDG